MVSKKSTALLGMLGILVILYHATPLKRAMDAAVLPLVSFFSPVARLGAGLSAIVEGARHGGDLKRRIAEQEQAIALFSRKSGAPADVPAGSAFPSVAGRVVAVNRVGDTRLLLIDQGSFSGVFEHTAVATPEGVFVGKVVSVFERFSLVLPASDQKSAVAAQRAGDASVQAVVRGTFGAGLTMELVVPDAELGVGDKVVTSLLEENTPAGLLFGAVEAVSYTEGELFKEALIIPAVSLSALSEVEIFIPLSFGP